MICQTTASFCSPCYVNSCISHLHSFHFEFIFIQFNHLSNYLTNYIIYIIYLISGIDYSVTEEKSCGFRSFLTEIWIILTFYVGDYCVFCGCWMIFFTSFALLNACNGWCMEWMNCNELTANPFAVCLCYMFCFEFSLEVHCIHFDWHWSTISIKNTLYFYFELEFIGNIEGSINHMGVSLNLLAVKLMACRTIRMRAI